MPWLDNATIYHIFIDRFAGYNPKNNWRKPDYMGGNLRGIIEKLPYIKSLGVNAIWISPFFKGRDFHGYHVTDYFSVDKRFGTEKDLKELIDKAHKLDLKVIGEMIPNHLSKYHPIFQEALNNKNSPYRDWFYFDKNNNYLCFLDLEWLPKIRLDHQPAIEHIRDAGLKWLEMGLDGFRFDHIIGVSNDNIAFLVNSFKQKFSDSIHFGEAAMFGIKAFTQLRSIRLKRKWIVVSTGSLGRDLMYENYAGILDGILDFSTMQWLEKAAKSNSKLVRGLIESKIKKHIARRKGLYSLNFLGNHDTQRFLAKVGGDKEKLKYAAKTQFALGQPSIIYYGDEVGMSNYKIPLKGTPYADIYARQPMIWDETKQDKELLEFFKELIRNKAR